MYYTSLKQSKKLVELGLKPETADMSYNFDDGNYYINTGPYSGWVVPKWSNPNLVLPCWSVSALMELLPPHLFEFERGLDLNIYRNLNGKGWHVSYMPNNIENMKKDKFRQISNGDTPIEAVYNMIVWLLENNYIKKN